MPHHPRENAGELNLFRIRPDNREDHLGLVRILSDLRFPARDRRTHPANINIRSKIIKGTAAVTADSGGDANAEGIKRLSDWPDRAPYSTADRVGDRQDGIAEYIPGGMRSEARWILEEIYECKRLVADRVHDAGDCQHRRIGREFSSELSRLLPDTDTGPSCRPTDQESDPALGLIAEHIYDRGKKIAADPVPVLAIG